jgi:hypothetical protein
MPIPFANKIMGICAIIGAPNKGLGPQNGLKSSLLGGWEKIR